MFEQRALDSRRPNVTTQDRRIRASAHLVKEWRSRLWRMARCRKTLPRGSSGRPTLVLSCVTPSVDLVTCVGHYRAAKMARRKRCGHTRVGLGNALFTLPPDKMNSFSDRVRSLRCSVPGQVSLRGSASFGIDRSKFLVESCPAVAFCAFP
jgi:hypothetical protein